MFVVAVMLAFSVVGGVNALVFSLRVRAVMSDRTRSIPALCGAKEGKCEDIAKTQHARLVGGILNSDFGVLYYALSAVWSVYSLISGSLAGLFLIQTASVCALLVSVYLANVLARRLHVVCVSCYLGHVTNLILATLACFAL
jgi:uncharacterized membrane protein